MITLIFGDSIAWGAFDYENIGWAEQLKKKGFKNDDFVYNCSISGNTSKDILSRMRDEIDYRLDPNDNLRIIFAFGTNDAGRIGYKRVTAIQDFRKNIIRIIDLAMDYTNEIYFVGLTMVDESKSLPVAWDKTLFYHNKDIIEYNDELKIMCRRNTWLKFINLINFLDVNDLEDGVHPNTKGHSIILNKVEKKLKK